eukprot:6184301-Pleurochrysis_carterae.AAC.3
MDAFEANCRCYQLGSVVGKVAVYPYCGMHGEQGVQSCGASVHGCACKGSKGNLKVKLGGVISQFVWLLAHITLSQKLYRPKADCADAPSRHWPSSRRYRSGGDSRHGAAAAVSERTRCLEMFKGSMMIHLGTC